MQAHQGPTCAISRRTDDRGADDRSIPSTIFFSSFLSSVLRSLSSVLMLIDSHCHLDFPDFAGDLDAVIARARAAGVARIVTISTRVRGYAEVLAIAERYPEIYCSVGTHPHHAHEELDLGADELVARDAPSQGGGDRGGGARLPLRQQSARCAGAWLSQPHRRSARHRIAAGHSFARRRRRTWRESWRRRAGRAPFPRCCIAIPAGRDLAERAIALGLFISFTGIVTFKKSDELRSIAKSLPARPHPGRDRCALSCARFPSRQAQRAGLSWSRPPGCWPRRAA